MKRNASKKLDCMEVVVNWLDEQSNKEQNRN